MKLTYHQILDEKWRQIFNHVVHLSVKFIWSEHVSVLFADLLDCFERKLDVTYISWVQVSNQLWDQWWPLSLHVAFTHEWYDLEQQACNLFFRASHQSFDKILLQQLVASLVYETVYLIFNSFIQILLLFIVVCIRMFLKINVILTEYLSRLTPLL